jgi:endonuclease/exonuclease/phosphatase family metal-dependent hydrolase
MKIISWNCNGALRKKLLGLDQVDADIIVVQECEDPSTSTTAYREWAGEYLWVGDNKNKGIGVFARHGYSIRALDWSAAFTMPGFNSPSPAMSWSTSDLKLFLPFEIVGGPTVLAVWTKGGEDKAFGYIGQLWKYLQLHREDLRSRESIVIGDLNSNSVWDKPDRWWNHSYVIEELEKIDLHSLYHLQQGEAQGSEIEPTFFLQRKREKPYHIDYMFVPRDRVDSSHLVIGDQESWLMYSDHLPLIVNLTWGAHNVAVE